MFANEFMTIINNENLHCLHLLPFKLINPCTLKSIDFSTKKLVSTSSEIKDVLVLIKFTKYI